MTLKVTDVPENVVYNVSGLRTRSDLCLSFLQEQLNFANAGIDVDIKISRDAPPIFRDQVVLQHTRERSVIQIQDIAHFEVTSGQQIRLWPASNASLKDIEVYLFGLVWASLCHQRGVLPLHASAILTTRGITGFIGHSGSGKSFTAACMSTLGHELVADDILPITFNSNGLPGAYPFLQRFKLKRDSIDELSLHAEGPVSERIDSSKNFVLPTYQARNDWRELHRVYLLETSSDVEGVIIEELSGADAVAAIADQTYHFEFVSETRVFREHLEFCAKLASKIGVYRLRRSPLCVSSREFKLTLLRHLEES
jgi:hypothetical protein